MAGRVRLRNQIIDRASQSATIASSSKGTLSVAGAVFPLLAGTAFRIYNIGGNVYDADNSLLVAVNDIYLYALFSATQRAKTLSPIPMAFSRSWCLPAPVGVVAHSWAAMVSASISRAIRWWSLEPTLWSSAYPTRPARCRSKPTPTSTTPTRSTVTWSIFSIPRWSPRNPKPTDLRKCFLGSFPGLFQEELI